MKTHALPTRDRIIAAASKLFYSAGIRAVSVDAVAEKAGLTKRTIYYHFASKDDLIAAYLDGRDQPNLALFQRWFSEEQGDPAEKVQAVFRNLAKAARSPRWKGCGYLRTAAELADMPGHPAIKTGIAHKQRVEAWLRQELDAGGAAEPAALARQIVVLLDGALAVVLLNRDVAYMEAAGDAAEALVRMALAQR